jgi:hypothetical protein
MARSLSLRRAIASSKSLTRNISSCDSIICNMRTISDHNESYITYAYIIRLQPSWFTASEIEETTRQEKW